MAKLDSAESPAGKFLVLVPALAGSPYLDFYSFIMPKPCYLLLTRSNDQNERSYLFMNSRKLSLSSRPRVKMSKILPA